MRGCFRWKYLWQLSRDGNCMVWACHMPLQPLQNHPSGHLESLGMEDMSEIRWHDWLDTHWFRLGPWPSDLSLAGPGVPEYGHDRDQVTWLTEHQVTWLTGHQVTWLTGHLVTWLTGHHVTRLTGHQVIELTGHQVTGLTGHQVTRLTGHQVTCLIGHPFYSDCDCDLWFVMGRLWSPWTRRTWQRSSHMDDHPCWWKRWWRLSWFFVDLNPHGPRPRNNLVSTCCENCLWWGLSKGVQIVTAVECPFYLHSVFSEKKQLL